MASFLFFSAALLSSALVADALGPGRTRGLKPPLLSPDVPLPEAKWIYQKLDHGSENSTYWKQRYFVNTTWWDGSGPVFLLLGGEGPANPAWLVADTSIMLLAQKYSGLVFSVEHRFYGESRPTEDVSLANLKYLSSRQALADFAYFQLLMAGNGLYNISSSSKWVVFGGSYSGALAAWFRQLYPQVVVGAIATSAPVLAKVNFVEYVEVTAASLATTGHGVECSNSVAEAFSTIRDMFADKTQWSSIEKMFNVRPPLKTQLDVANLAENLAGVFEGVVQYNRDNKDFEGRPNNITIEYLCGFMTNTSLGTSLERFVQLNKALFRGAPNNADYDGMVRSMNATSWNSGTAKAGERQWTYQTCTEFGYFQTTESKTTPLFSDLIPLEYYLDICQQVFNLSRYEVLAAIISTNQFYGGRNISATDILFPNGSIDQWHALGVTSDLSASVQALFMEGTAHCADMYPPSSQDVSDLVAGRDRIMELVGTWVESSVRHR